MYNICPFGKHRTEITDHTLQLDMLPILRLISHFKRDRKVKKMYSIRKEIVAATKCGKSDLHFLLYIAKSGLRDVHPVFGLCLQVSLYILLN